MCRGEADALEASEGPQPVEAARGCRQGLQARGCRQRAADKQLQARLEDLRAALDAGSCGEKVPGLAYPTIGPPNLTTIESNRSITFAIQILSFP